MKQVPIEEILYPKFNTLRIDTDDLDGRPYKPGANRLGPRIPQKRFDMDRDRDSTEIVYIEPGARMMVEKQEQFYEAIFKWPEVFFGGARGDGKTYALLLSHIVKHLSWMARGITGQTSAMFSETKVQLQQRHEVLLPLIFPKYLGWYDPQQMIYHFHQRFGGGVIMFLYVGNRKNDIERLLSYNLAYITVDELTRQSEHSFMFISSCLRSSVVPASEWCVASASNPGSKGHKWVQRRYVKKRERDKAAIKGERRYFIKALPEDNPLLPKSYWNEQLNKLPPKMARAYKGGDWTVFEGQYFDMLDDEIHIIPKGRIPDEVVKYVGIDFGTNHPSGCVWVAHFPKTEEYPDGRFVVYRYFEKKDKYPNRVKAEIWDRMKHDKNVLESKVLSHDAFANRQSTEGYLTVAQRFNTRDKWGPNMGCVPSSKGKDSRKNGWRKILSLLFFEDRIVIDDRGVPQREIIQPPQLYFMDTPEIRMLFEELQNMQHREDDSEDCEKQCGNEYEVGEGDEGPDALRHVLELVGEDDDLIQDSYEEEKEPWNPMRDFDEDEYMIDVPVGYTI